MWEQGGWVPEEGLVKVPCPQLAGQGISRGSSHNPVPVHAPLAPVGPCKLQTDLGGAKPKKESTNNPLYSLG